MSGGRVAPEAFTAQEIEAAFANFAAAAPSRESFLADRQTCIGGSDAASLFSEGYGCLRRLFYSKRGVPQDFSIDDLPVIRRGQKLERVAAEEFSIQSGRAIQEVGLARHPEHPEIGVHLDRVQIADFRPDPGVVEIKVLGRETFAKLKRDGIQIDYQMQVQHGMLVTGAKWGTFVAFWADGFELKSWDVERDDELCEMIRAAAVDTWKLIQENSCEMPERLPADDKRCARCQWRRTCQDQRLLEIMDAAPEDQLGFDPSLAALAAEYEDASEIASEANAVKEAIGARLKEVLEDRQVVDTNGYRVYYKTLVRNGIDTAALKKQMPDVAKQFTKATPYRSLRVFARS